jgi:prepilin-type N-terminal cleavage/methylation domain-containing protein
MNRGKRRGEPGDWRPETGDQKPEPGDLRPETGDGRREAGERKSKIGNRKSDTGFTLLELLLSLALVGLLLVAMNQFIFSMGELWGRGADVRLFDQHVRAVTRFVEQTLHGTAMPTARGVQGLAVQEIRLPDGPTATLLTFELPAGSRVLPWPEAPLPDVVCALGMRPEQGLVLYWHSRLEQHFADEPPRATVLTPLVTSLSYDYYDPNFKTWQNYQGMQRDKNSQWLLPTRLRLKFTYENLTRETVVTLPVSIPALPPF